MPSGRGTEARQGKPRGTGSTANSRLSNGVSRAEAQGRTLARTRSALGKIQAHEKATAHEGRWLCMGFAHTQQPNRYL